MRLTYTVLTILLAAQNLQSQTVINGSGSGGGGGGSGTGNAGSLHSDNISGASPTIACSSTSAGTTDVFIETLTDNVSGSYTISNCTQGQGILLTFCQNGVGGYTLTQPSNLRGFPTISSTAGYCTAGSGYYNGTNIIINSVIRVHKNDLSDILGSIVMSDGLGGSSTITPTTGTYTYSLPAETGTFLLANTRALVRVCDIIIGDTSGSVVTDAQLGPQKSLCFVPAASTVVEIDVQADGGTPNIIVGKDHAGSVSNFVSSALATASSGGRACSKTSAVAGIDGTTCSATLQNTSISAGDYIKAVSGTAGGVAKLMTVHVVYTVN